MDLSYTTTLIRWSEKFILFWLQAPQRKRQSLLILQTGVLFLVKEWHELWHVHSTKKNRAFIEMIAERVTKAAKVKCIAIVSTLSFHHTLPIITICCDLNVLWKRFYLDHLSNKPSCINKVFKPMQDTKKKNRKWSQTIVCDGLVDTANAGKKWIMWKIKPEMGLRTAPLGLKRAHTQNFNTLFSFFRSIKIRWVFNRAQYKEISKLLHRNTNSNYASK